MPAQDKGIDEAFWPILQMDEPPESKWSNHWSLRVGTMGAVAATLWVILTYAPETGVWPSPAAVTACSMQLAHS